MEILMMMTDRFHRGGTQTDMVQLAGALVARGHVIHVAAARGDLTPALARAGVHCHEVRQPLGGPTAVLDVARDIGGLLRGLNVDVVAPQSVRATLAAGMLRRVGRLPQPIVTSIHNLHNPAGARTARRILRHCADVVTFENHYERTLVGLAATAAGNETRVVYSGIDLETFRPAGPPVPAAADTGRCAVCVARLSEEKNHALLLDTWRHHAGRHPKDRLLVVGDGPLHAALAAQVERLAIAGSVNMLGDRDDIPELLRGADLFVLASSRESYPRAAREALACGVPVLLPDIGACGEIARDPACSSLFPSCDLDSLAGQLGRWLDPATDRTTAAVAARRLAERLFPREAWVDAMEGIYERERRRAAGNSEAGRAA